MRIDQITMRVKRSVLAYFKVRRGPRRHGGWRCGFQHGRDGAWMHRRPIAVGTYSTCYQRAISIHATDSTSNSPLWLPQMRSSVNRKGEKLSGKTMRRIAPSGPM